MGLRSAVGSLQLPVAGLGVLLLVFSVSEAATISEPPTGEGFLAGLAVLVLYFLAWGGVFLTALGFAIPPGDGYGVQFSRRQRGLFVLSAASAVASAVLPFVAFGALFAAGMSGNGTFLLLAWGGPMALSVLALVGGLGWRAAEAVAPRLRHLLSRRSV